MVIEARVLFPYFVLLFVKLFTSIILILTFYLEVFFYVFFTSLCFDIIDTMVDYFLLEGNTREVTAKP